MAVLFIVLAAVGIQAELFHPSDQPPVQSFLAVLLALYSVGAHGERRRAIFGGAVAGAVIVALDLWRGFFSGGNPEDFVPGWIFLVLSWVIGWTLHKSRVQAVLLQDRAARLVLRHYDRGG